MARGSVRPGAGRPRKPPLPAPEVLVLAQIRRAQRTQDGRFQRLEWQTEREPGAAPAHRDRARTRSRREATSVTAHAPVGNWATVSGCPAAKSAARRRSTEPPISLADIPFLSAMDEPSSRD